MNDTENNNINNNENLLYARVNFSRSFLFCGLSGFSLFSENAFLFVSLSLLCVTFLSLYLHDTTIK